MEPLSYFFVGSGIPQDIDIAAMNIYLPRRRLEGFPKKIMVINFVFMLKRISMDPACCKSCACVYGKYVQCFGANNSVQFLWIDIHYPIFFFFNGFSINIFSLESYLPLLC
jgi:hypothetical protein